jgi:hypothetical protein
MSYSISVATPTNLEVIINSIDSLAQKSKVNINNNNLKLHSEYSDLFDKLESSYKNLDSNYQITNSTKYGTLISLDTIQIEYNTANSTRTIRLVANIQTLDDSIIASYTTPYIYTDTIDTDNINQFENESYLFTKGRLIEESSFWDDAIEPAIYVGSAVVIIYLLFTVRSS